MPVKSQMRAAPGVEGFSQGTDLSRTYVVDELYGYQEYFYSFSITPFTAVAGTTYWLGLHNGPLTSNSYDTPDFFWEKYNPSGIYSVTSSGKAD